MDITVNFWAVLVAAIVSMGVGTLWFGTLFGKTWTKLMGFTQEQMDQARAKGMGAHYAAQLVASLIMAYVLAHFVEVWGVIDIATSFQLAFWAWLGFVATVLVSSVLWEGKSVRLYAINVGYWLVNIFVMTLVINWLS